MIIIVIIYLKTGIIQNYVLSLSAYRAVNTSRLVYNNQPFNVV